jgi:hypothetical protein
MRDQVLTSDEPAWAQAHQPRDCDWLATLLAAAITAAISRAMPASSLALPAPDCSLVY